MPVPPVGMKPLEAIESSQLRATSIRPPAIFRLLPPVTYTPPEPFVPEREWTLLPGSGPRRVFVLFRDSAGNPTLDSDQITLLRGSGRKPAQFRGSGPI